MTKLIGIVDEPVRPGNSDNLDINIHSKALIKYVADTTTLITIGIQGEWENRLKIENGPKKLKAKGISVDNNLEEYSKLALMYLVPNYKYGVGN